MRVRAAVLALALAFLPAAAGVPAQAAAPVAATVAPAAVARTLPVTAEQKAAMVTFWTGNHWGFIRVFNYWYSYWPVHMLVDWTGGGIDVAQGNWANWNPKTYDVVDSVYNGYGSCLNYYWTVPGGSNWYYYGTQTVQDSYYNLVAAFPYYMVVAQPWGGIDGQCH